MDGKQIVGNIEKIRGFMNEHDIDLFYISSTNQYLNEYVPLDNCHRFYFTGFTGSTADVLIPKNGRVILFVDGRYHEQADLEVDHDIVEVEKCPHGVSLGHVLLERIKSFKCERLGIEGDRTSYTLKCNFDKIVQTISFDQGEIGHQLSKPEAPSLKMVTGLEIDICGETTSEKARRILDQKQAFFITSLDSISWLTNCRGFHLPFQSTFFSRCLCLRNKIYVFVDQNCPIEDSLKNDEMIKFEFGTHEKTAEKLEIIKREESIEQLFYDSKSISSADYNMVKNIWGNGVLTSYDGGLSGFHSIKNEKEIIQMEESFSKADKSVYESILWLKKQIEDKMSVKEIDFFDKVNSAYKSGGAIDQSFNTIAAVGEHSSIIHFSNSSEKEIKDGDMILLDSGAIYKNGFSTDKTRTFLVGKNPTAEQIRIYTLVLKGFLGAGSAVFTEGTWGAAIDAMARIPMMKHGYNFAHGTGHGVGINVHEGGIRISPLANMPLKPGQVCSIEPGIYLPGKFGVRLENVVTVEKHPEYEGMLHFRPLVYIGLEHQLIDFDLLTFEEKRAFDDYESECAVRGTSFKSN